MTTRRKKDFKPESIEKKYIIQSSVDKKHWMIYADFSVFSDDLTEQLRLANEKMDEVDGKYNLSLRIVYQEINNFTRE